MCLKNISDILMDTNLQPNEDVTLYITKIFSRKKIKNKIREIESWVDSKYEV